MADTQNKRKQGPGGPGGSNPKKRQGGNGGKWQTPHQKARMSEQTEMGRTLAVGDEGIWITYARGMRAKAIRELRALCDEYGESLYGIIPEWKANSGEGNDEKEGLDIEASIEQELNEMKAKKPASRRVFTIVSVGLECVCFIKTMKPVDPVQLVLKICEDARACSDIMQRKVKYVNRFTPVCNTEKATEAGIDRVVREVLAPTFKLNPAAAQDGEEAEATPATVEQPADETNSSYAYAIRQDIRSNKGLKSLDLINRVASVVAPCHKVNLTKPDKVILVQVFIMYCGVSVVSGNDYERYKRFNVNELYRMAAGDQAEKGNAEEAATEQGEKEAPAVTQS